MNYYPALHTLRGAASIWVLLFHIWFLSGSKDFLFSGFFNMGWVGVHLFYALSAFLLGTIFFQKSQLNNWDIKSFYKKRFLRIFPAYYFQLAILLALSVTSLYQFPNLKEFLSHLFMFFNLPPTNVSPINGVWWTLPIEFMFYLVMPLLVIFILKYGIKMFLFFSLFITFFYRYVIFISYKNEPIGILSNKIGQLPGVLIVFSFGLIFAYLVSKNKIKINNKIIIIFAIFALFFWSKFLLDNMESYWSDGTLLLYWESINALLLMCLIVSVYKSNNIFFNNKIFEWLGKISYGIYLWHLPILLFMKQYISDFIPLLITVFPLTLIFAAFSYYFIERKFFQPPN